MAKKKKENPLRTFSGTTIDLAKFNLETDKKQYEIIETTLKDIYKDDLEVTKKHVRKVINLTYNPKDDYIYLPYDLKVSKEKLELNFRFDKKVIGFGWILFGLWLLLFALIGASYYGIRYINMVNLNKDIDGDGIADINIDINNDGKAEINVDTNGNNKPDLNVDYKGNRKAVFNIDTDDDGKPDSNLINDASTSEKRKVCTINCDINGDGWPDLNLDLDGDGKPDLDIDTDGDGNADLNLDLNGDGVCDIMCDLDGDDNCDSACIKPPKDNEINTGTSTITGDPGTGTSTPQLLLRFDDGVTVNVNSIFPDDQPNMENQVKPYKEFTVENLSDYTMYYTLGLEVVENTFVTNNFKYRLTGTNGGISIDYTTAPTKDITLGERIAIPARTIQKYRLEFNLVGINAPQNIDQSKRFKANVKIET